MPEMGQSMRHSSAGVRGLPVRPLRTGQQRLLRFRGSSRLAFCLVRRSRLARLIRLLRKWRFFQFQQNGFFQLFRCVCIIKPRAQVLHAHGRVLEVMDIEHPKAVAHRSLILDSQHFFKSLGGFLVAALIVHDDAKQIQRL